MRLHIAQPALSRQVQKLEASLGVLLFKRSKRQVEMTVAGTVFLERTKQLLADLDKAAQDARRASTGEVGALVVGFIHSSTYWLLPTILDRFRNRYPDVTLELHEMTIREQQDALRRRSIDVGLLRPPLEDESIETEVILEEQFLLAVAQTHRLADRGHVILSDVAHEPFILFSSKRSALLRSRSLTLFQEAGFVPNGVQEATQIHTVVGLVSAGIGVALVPRGVAWHLIVRMRRFRSELAFYCENLGSRILKLTAFEKRHSTCELGLSCSRRRQ